MSLKLMYITNKPEIAQIAEIAGVDRIFVDMEYIGKSDRQGGMDTVQSYHTVEDVKRISEALTSAELLVRINPMHEASEKYCSSREEINEAIANGANILMLPYFKTAEEVQQFVEIVNGRAKTMPLVETPESVKVIEDILKLNIDEIFIGLNDLSLGYGKKFMFELLTDGIVEELCNKFKKKNIPYGFGGIAALGKGMLPAEKVITEHYRLGSSCAILSRSFCNTNMIKHMGKISVTFMDGVKEIRLFEKEVEKHAQFFQENIVEIHKRVQAILETMK